MNILDNLHINSNEAAEGKERKGEAGQMFAQIEKNNAELTCQTFASAYAIYVLYRQSTIYACMCVCPCLSFCVLVCVGECACECKCLCSVAADIVYHSTLFALRFLLNTFH